MTCDGSDSSPSSPCSAAFASSISGKAACARFSPRWLIRSRWRSGRSDRARRSGAAREDRGEDTDEAEGHADREAEDPLTKLADVLVNAVELTIDSVEPLVDLVEPVADRTGKIVESLVSPPASLHGHPRIVAGIARSRERRGPAPRPSALAARSRSACSGRFADCRGGTGSSSSRAG